MLTLPSREEVEAKYTWNAESVFENTDAWEAEYEALSQDYQQITAYQGKLSESPQMLLAVLQLHEQLRRRRDRLVMYAFFAQATDIKNQDAAARSTKVGSVQSKLTSASAFIEPEILAIGAETLDEWQAEEPQLGIYQHYFAKLIHRAQHIRSAEIEEVLGLVVESFEQSRVTYNVLANADLEFGNATASTGDTAPISQSNIRTLLLNGDRALRRNAFEQYSDEHLAFKNTLASNLVAAMKQRIFYMRVRGFESVLHASLHEHKIPVSVFHTLIETFQKHLPTWHRYWRIKRQALGVDTLQPYDIWAPLTDAKPYISYEQAVDWISEGMQPLGNAYVETMRRGCLEERWVDSPPNMGKRQGAFSYGSYDTFPFIMMSYDGTFESMSTLAHELGHSMHSYHTRKTQPYVYGHYSMFLAEVASNFNQAMVRTHLFETQRDQDFQIGLLDEAMTNFHRYFFIMPTLSRFELEAYTRLENGQALTADSMIDLMADLFSDGFGGEMEINRENIGIIWAQFGHLYVGYYPFQYATGISGAHALADKVRNENGREAYLEFLKAGSSRYPLDVLKAAGVDLSTPEPVEKTFGVLADLVDRLETLTS